MKTLYRFELDCGRMGTLEGVFVADDSMKWKALEGKSITFLKEQ
jgi:hypothetical protein